MNESKFNVPALLPQVKLIPLTQGQFAIVDESDFEWLNQYKWRAKRSPRSYSFYAAAHINLNEKRTDIQMHSLILGISGGDHEDGNGLNNTRRNLRSSTESENNRNRRKPKNNTSGFKGVHWESKVKIWRARISVHKHKTSIGSFKSAVEAAIAYDEAALRMHGKFARTNAMMGLLPMKNQFPSGPANGHVVPQSWPEGVIRTTGMMRFLLGLPLAARWRSSSR